MWANIMGSLRRGAVLGGTAIQIPMVQRRQAIGIVRVDPFGAYFSASMKSVSSAFQVTLMAPIANCSANLVRHLLSREGQDARRRPG